MILERIVLIIFILTLLVWIDGTQTEINKLNREISNSKQFHESLRNAVVDIGILKYQVDVLTETIQQKGLK